MRASISDADLTRILSDRLRGALEERPTTLTDAFRLDRDYLAPLSLILERKEEERRNPETRALIDEVRRHLRCGGSSDTGSPSWLIESVDTESMYEQVNDQTWKALKDLHVELRVPVLEDISEPRRIEAYEMLELEVTPREGTKRVETANSFAFQHGFTYRWSVERKDEFHPLAWRLYLKRWWRKWWPFSVPHHPPAPEPLLTREPRAQLYIPWEQATCTIKVEVYRDDSEVLLGEPEETQPINVSVDKSALRRHSAQLRWQDLVVLTLVFLTAIFAGIATDQFAAAMHGSLTALFTLFTTGMALQNLQHWTYGGANDQKS